jgi:hypothetical protein
MMQIMVVFPNKDTKYDRTYFRRLDRYTFAVIKAIGLCPMPLSRNTPGWNGVRLNYVDIPKNEEIAFYIRMDESWTVEDANDLLKYIKNIKKVKFADLTIDPTPVTIPT